jgi:hypothetical protein
MKVTRKMLEAQIAFLNRNLNRPAEYMEPSARCNVRHFHLGANSPGDGWTRYSLLETVNEGGAVHEHFHGNGQDLYAYLRGIDDATRLQAFPKLSGQ